MEKLITDLKEKLFSIEDELKQNKQRKAQLEHMSDEIWDEIVGYRLLEKNLEKQRKAIADAKKEKEGEETCGKDLSDSMFQKDDE